MRKNLSFIVFWGALALALLIYWPGLRGGFLFDDQPNLSAIGTYGGVKDWDTFKSFVFGGQAGPLGRPLALASFLLNANDWPADPRSFKLTNLWLHLLCAVLLCWATFNLLRFYGLSDDQAWWGAVLNMALWLLHPYMVSTTLYVVQRMAQLATLFMLAGIAGYLHGRLLLYRSTRKRESYVWMSISLGCGTVLAAFSKENGILLPLLVLLIEWCHPQRAEEILGREKTNVPLDLRWAIIFLWLPSALVVGALIRHIDLSPDPWPTRPFNQIERLMSESRIIWEYIFHLIVPRVEGRGLFQDGIEISKGLLEPSSTLVSILGLLATLIFLCFIRKRGTAGALMALAGLFFFASHLVESTVIALELYFEHRNYAAAAFLFLPLVMGIVWITEKKSLFVGGCTALIVCVMLSALTWKRVELWSDTNRLQTYWAITTPNSARAQNYLAAQLFNNGQAEQAIAFLDSASERLPQSSLLSIQNLLMKVQLGKVSKADYQRVRSLLPFQRFDAQAVTGVRWIVDLAIRPSADSENRQEVFQLIDAMEGLPQYRNVAIFQRLLPYMRGRLLLADGEVIEATKQLREAIWRYRETDASLSMVADAAEAGYPRAALELLNEARSIYAVQPERTLRRSKSVYDSEIERLDRMLREDIASEQGN